MSDIANEYACDSCTYIQSTNVPKCQMCDTPNPNYTTTNDATPSLTKMVCPRCTYENSGVHIRVCEICQYDFDTTSLKRLLSESIHEEEEEDEDVHFEDVDDDDEIDVASAPDSKEKKPKVVEAVEKPMDEKELKAYYKQYITLVKEQRQQTKEHSDRQLHEIITQLFHSLQYKNTQPEGQLVFRCCQICYDVDEPVITLKACGHRMICPDDFHQYLATRIRDGDLLPWIPCPAEICSVPCDAENIVQDGRLTYAELLLFIITYMSKKLSRNENFISCVHCERGGFLQMGPPTKQLVTCEVCHVNQTIEKGSDGDLDVTFKQMIHTGQLRECPTCRHLTLKEKGLCNVIECAKCGIWWNWRTREQGHDGKDLKQRARMSGTLWEPGELHYQQDLERRNPQEFKALLERNGITYNPNYVRGGWNDR